MFEQTLVTPLILTLTHTGKSESGGNITSDFVQDFQWNISKRSHQFVNAPQWPENLFCNTSDRITFKSLKYIFVLKY